MLQFNKLNGFLYVGDVLFLAALATTIIKLKLENSSQGFSAKTQGVYGVVLCTRNIDLLFLEGSLKIMIYCIVRKFVYISCIIYIVIKINKTSKNNPTCSCNQDSFWVEALVLPCMIVTAVFHYGPTPDEVLWSFSTYLETVAMVPQFYLIHVRGKGDSYLPAYIALMATYTLTDAMAYSINAFIDGNMPVNWAICKCIQLALYGWYLLIPREAVLPVANCEERRRKTTMFMRQQSLLAQTLLQKNNSSTDLQVYVLHTPRSSASFSICSTPSQQSLEFCSPGSYGDSPPASPCVKFDPAIEAETFRLKAPKLTMKQLKNNKGSLQLKSLPSSPLTPRRVEFLKSSATVASFRSMSELSENNINSQDIAKMPRVRKIGVSLPSSPEPNRKSELQFKSALLRGQTHRSKFKHHSVKMKKYHSTRSNVSLPSTPEAVRKSEIILKAPTHAPLYRSFSHLPTTHNCSPPVRPNRPPLPTLNGSLQSIPTIERKTEFNVSVTSETSQTPSTISSPKPERPPPPKLERSLPSTPLSEKKSEVNAESSRTTRPGKPSRPPLPKLILSAPESTTLIYRF